LKPEKLNLVYQLWWLRLKEEKNKREIKRILVATKIIGIQYIWQSLMGSTI
jgi:hypothetical protein